MGIPIFFLIKAMVLVALLAILGVGVSCYLIGLCHGEKPFGMRYPAKSGVATHDMTMDVSYPPPYQRAHTPFPESGRRSKHLTRSQIKRELDLLLVRYRQGHISESEYLRQADVLIDLFAVGIHQ